MKSVVPNGQMIIIHNDYLPAPQVFVKISDNNADEPSLFINNTALVRKSINPNYAPSITEMRRITDRYYTEMVEKGNFVPIADLNETTEICREKGWPEYKIDLDNLMR